MIARVSIEVVCDLCRATRVVSRLAPKAATFAAPDAMDEVVARGWSRKIVRDGRSDRVIAVCPACKDRP